MKIGVPWRVKGIRPDARETAREAARRAGMSVGEWLNTVIIDSADEEGVRMSRRGRGYDDEEDDDQLFAIHERLDQLSDQFDRLQHRSAPAPRPQAHGPEAYAPPAYFQNRANEARDSQIAEAIARLDRRMDELVVASRVLGTPPAHGPQPAHYAPERRPAEPARPAAPNPDTWMPDVDQAMAEIRARMHALDVDPNVPAAHRPEPPQAAPQQAYAYTAPMPAQNLAGLEQQLRHITGQIEALRQQPQLEEGLAALRETLRDIARTLLDAMPRQAIDALEAEVRALAARLDQTRSAGVDANTLGAIEQGLTEIRDTLHTLTPAEGLDGFRQAVHSLAQKVDMLGASAPDMNAYQQLEEAISTLRGIVNHVASNEALQQLAGEVHALAQKVDQVAAVAAANIGGTDHGALEILDQRIAHIANALESRVQNGGSVPPELDAVIHGLTEKIERLQHSPIDEAAFAQLEGRVAQLLEKLDASGARFSQLEAIERGLGDLVAHLESQRAAPVAPQMEGLQRDLVRTQTSLEAVHGTLGHVVDRLAMLESDMRGARPQPQSQQQPAQHHEPSPLAFDASPDQSPMPAAPQLDMPALAEPPMFAAPAPELSPPPSREVAHAQAAAAMARANPRSAGRPPIDPNLPPDEPLEPGYAPGHGRASSAERIAASEAALGPARRAEPADQNSTSNFIAAARRAARAAASEPTTADLRAAALQNEVEEKASKSFAQRVRQLFVGASVIVIGAGGLRIAAELFDLGIDFGNAPATQTAAVVPAQPENAPLQDTPTLFAPKPQTTPAPQTTASNDSTAGDVTGSLPLPAPAAQPAAPYLSPPTYDLSIPPVAPQPEKLPVAIGGPSLRTAAAAGDAAAEFEIATRYAEGRGVAANASEAARWFELAARQGLVMAQFRLAGFYEKGIGVKKDTETARRLYRSAADQGNAKAMHNLAVLYAEGAAVKPDYRSAAQWFRSAAEYGLPDSQYNLAILYARGIGVDQNLVESYKWFALAAAQGDGDAGTKRDEVAKRLDAQALNTAKLAVTSFVAQRQPEAAISVKAPPGGWDAAASNPPEPAPKTKRAAPVRVGSR